MAFEAGSLNLFGLDLTRAWAAFSAGWSEALRWRALSWLNPDQSVRLLRPDGTSVWRKGASALPAPAGNDASAVAVLLPDDIVLYRELLLPDLGAAKVGPALAATDSTVRYTIHYLNSGLGLAFGALLSDELPYGLEYDSDDSGLPHSQPQPGVHVWTLDNLPSGARGQFELVVRVTGLANAPVAINKVRITSPVPDALPASNEGQWSMLVRPYRVYLPLVRRAAPVP